MAKIKELEFEDINTYKILIGEYEENLKSIGRMLDISISSRGGKIFLKGDDERVNLAERAINELYREISEGFAISKSDVERKIIEVSRKKDGSEDKGERKTNEEPIIVTYRGKKIYPRTENQRKYVDSMYKNEIIFSFGPAGTGKTYLAIAVAVRYLKSGQVAKIVLTRPAVEAGEKIGYLPGGILEKVDPFMRPIYDCLYDILDYREFTKLMTRGVIEITPIAFMRGRTISDSFIIVDEAQNLTYEQAKMTLTRMGIGSKMVLTADLTQVDIQKSGLVELEKILSGIEGIDFVHLDAADVVRHPVVSRIIQAFDRYEKR
ncbi:MAG: PhoH family protein [bacterium]|nr:PhoH family protein [bacterium]MDW8086976.1 PhoH family protein [Candidatus Calescibacterium sp.]